MSAPPVSELRRIAATTPRAPLRGPTSFYVGSAAGGGWNQELPGTSIELVLELDGAWDLDLDGRRTRVRSFAAGMVAGTVRSRPRGPTRLVQLAVDPLSVPALFGVPAGQLSGEIIAADALLGASAERLLEQLDAAGRPAAVAEWWACQRIGAAEESAGRQPPADVERAAALLRASRGTLRIDALAAELGCSRRHLARRFAEWIGVTPSEYRRLARFEHATAQLQAAPGQPLGELAHDCGYADHAHMDREFAALAGATPSAVAARLQS